MLTEIHSESQQRMEKCLQAFREAIIKYQAGRADPNLVSQVEVPYYQQLTPLNQLASIDVAADRRTILISPFEKNLLAAISKAIVDSNLGYNPIVTGDVLRIPLPTLTTERRKELAKQMYNELERCKVSIRMVRQDAQKLIKGMLKSKDIGIDDEKRAQAQIQNLTDNFIKQAANLAEAKESELINF